MRNGITGNYSSIAGGATNLADGPYSFIGAGFSNVTSGTDACVPGGYNNTASGNQSLATGYSATASHAQSFVWSSGSTATASSAANSVTMRAPNGFRFFTTTGAVGAQLTAGATAWSVLSDSTMKMDRRRVDTRGVLDKLATMNVDTWRYKHQPGGPLHMGPMAQDLHAAFGLGDDNVTISTIDADGVLFAATQELAKQNAQKDKLIGDLEARVKQLEQIILQFGNEHNSNSQ